MNGQELEDAIQKLGLTKTAFARLVDVSVRAVNLWTSEQRKVPGPVVSYVKLLLSLPIALREVELARIKSEPPTPLEGFFLMTLKGQEKDETRGFILLASGRVFGSDGTVSYDGTYKPSSKEGFLDVEVTVTVPEGVRLVTGFPEKDVPYSFRVNATLPAPRSAKHQEEVETPVQTPFGPVELKLQFLREFPRDLAAWVQGSQRQWA
jgi:hypothetical protein